MVYTCPGRSVRSDVCRRAFSDPVTIMHLQVAICELITLLYISACLCLPYPHPPLAIQEGPHQHQQPQINEAVTLNPAALASGQLENNAYIGASKSVHNQVQTKHFSSSKSGRIWSGMVEWPPTGVNKPDSYLRYSHDALSISKASTSGSETDGKFYNYFKNVYKSKERGVGKTAVESGSSNVKHVEDDNARTSTTINTGANVLDAASNFNPHLTAGRSERVNSNENGKQYTGSNETGVNVRLLDGTQLAMQADPSSGKHTEVSDLLLMVGTSLATLFALGLVLGIFGCCCRRAKHSEVTENGQEQKNKVLPNVDSAAIINQSELPNAEEDQDESLSVKDKIRALDKQLILQPSPNPMARRSSPDPRKKLRESQQLLIVVSDKDDLALQTSSTVASRENVSRSDTQDDISDITMDNESMHSSVISQPHNPDVVIADEGEPDEFAEIQRGTVILKSFQRVKPPRNRSPATRNSKGRIRKSRPVLDQKVDNNKTIHDTPDDTRKLQDTPADTRKPYHKHPDARKPELTPTPRSKPVDTNEKLKVRPPETSRRSRPLSASIPVIHGSLADKVKTRSEENLCDQPDTQSIFSDLKDLNAIKNKLAAIQSQQDKQPELPSSHKKRLDTSDNNGQIKASEIPSLYKSKESPKSDVSSSDNWGHVPSHSKKGPDSPKHRQSECETDTRLDSPTRHKKHKSSPAVNKKRLKKHEGESSSLPRTDTRSEDRDGTESNDAARENRLSAIPAGAQNNIFYLIDPTVKNKCQSAGELIAKQNAQYRKKSEETTVSKHRMMGHEDTTDSPVKRERTLSDPSRNSQVLEQTDL